MAACGTRRRLHGGVSARRLTGAFDRAYPLRHFGPAAPPQVRPSSPRPPSVAVVVPSPTGPPRREARWARGRSDLPAMLLTARDLEARGFARRTAQRLLAKLARQGHATTIPTGGRRALAVDAATLATLAGTDLEAVTECR